jgi:hypothetical protein
VKEKIGEIYPLLSVVDSLAGMEEAKEVRG